MGQQRIRQLQRQAATPTAAPPAHKPFSWQRPFPLPAPDTATSAPQPILDLQARLEILRRANPDWSKVKASSNPAKAVQAKLTVGAPNDQYEQEADRVADQVMSMPDAATQPPVQREAKPEEELQAKPLAAAITPLVQREAMPEEEDPIQKKASGNADIQREEIPEEEEVLTKPLSSGTLQREEMAPEEDDLHMKSLGTADLQREEMPEEHEELQMKPLGAADLRRTARPEDDESLQPKSSPTPHTPHPTPSLETQLSNTQGSGSPLPNDVRSFMEPRFGADFSQVRVHTGSEAVQMNRDLNAQAFTHKQDVYFGDGKAPAKDVLTAHELTHVVQQTSGIQPKLTLDRSLNKSDHKVRTSPVTQFIQTACESCQEEDEQLMLKPNSSTDLSSPTYSAQEVIQRYSHQDCSENDLSTKVWPADWLARQMTSKAINVLSTTSSDPRVQAILAKYFMTRTPNISAIISIYRTVQSKFSANNYTYECEDKCDGSLGYVYAIWSDVHLCMDILRSYSSELIARTIVHEFSHNYAGTDDKNYCKSGACPPGLSITDALNNADSYACFAYDLWFSGI